MEDLAADFPKVHEIETAQVVCQPSKVRARSCSKLLLSTWRADARTSLWVSVPRLLLGQARLAASSRDSMKGWRNTKTRALAQDALKRLIGRPR